MSQLTSTLKVVVNASGAQSGAAQVTASMVAMSNSSTKAINSMNSRMGAFEKQMKSVGSQIRGIAKQVIGITAFYQFSKSIVDATQKFAAFMAISKVSTGSLEKAGESFEYIRKVSDRLGVNLETNIKTFGKFQAAMRPMDKSGELTRQVFEGLSVAASGLHLNAYQLELSFKAIEQAASKNKPTLEEFQRQLAEHIPGAMAYLAEGVGLRMDQIHNAISKGTISIKDLLTGFANVLKSKFGEAAEYASKQLPAAIERLRNSFFLFYVEISKKGASQGLLDLTKGISDLLGRADVTQAIGTMFKNLGASIRTFLNSITRENMLAFGNAISTATDSLVWFVSNIKLLATILASFIAAGWLLKIATYIKLLGIGASGSAIGVTALRTAFIGLRAAMLGPLGILALIGSLIYLLSKLDSRKSKPITVDVRDVNGNIITGTSTMGGSNKNTNNVNAKFGGSNMFTNAQKGKPLSGQLNANDLKTLGTTEDLSLNDLLKTMTLPGDTPVGKTGKGSGAGSKKDDPLEGFINDTTISKIKEYNKLLDILEKRKSSMSFEQYSNTYQNISDKFITLVDGAKYFDSASADMAQNQSDSITELQSEIFDAITNAKTWQMELGSTVNTLASSASGDVFGPLFQEVNQWFDDEIKKLKEISGLGPEIVANITNSINAIKSAKMSAAEVTGANALLNSSQSIISAKEQSLQSQVITGLISEGQARMKLRTIIGEQGQALSQNLLPILERIIKTTTNPETLAGMQAMVDKIGEMVQIGKQTTWFEGLKTGLRDYANEAGDIFSEVKDVTVKAFKGMEDALVEYVTTGKLNFKDLAKSIISDLIRIQIQQSIMKPLAQAASGALSSIGSSLVSLFLAKGGAFSGGNIQAFASGGVLGPNGGIFNGPTIFPFAKGGKLGLGGEAGDEAAMPLKRMAGGKLGVYSEGSGGSESINIAITVNDNRTQTEKSSNDENETKGAKLAEIIRYHVNEVIVKEQRSGGLLA